MTWKKLIRQLKRKKWQIQQFYSHIYGSFLFGGPHYLVEVPPSQACEPSNKSYDGRLIKAMFGGCGQKKKKGR